MACQRLNQFCCGCTLPFGVKTILLLNFLQNFFYLATITLNVIFKVPTFGYNTSLEQQTFNAGFCLVGLCFVACGVFGVSNKLEPHLRLFLYYLIINFFIDTVYMFVWIFSEDTCAMLPEVLSSQGSAFACGATRLLSVAFLITVFILDAYCVFVVWSYCEDLRIGGAGEAFDDLLHHAHSAKHQKRFGGYSDGLFGVGEARDGPFPVNYGSIATPGIGGSTPLFGGSYHETDYPPKGG